MIFREGDTETLMLLNTNGYPIVANPIDDVNSELSHAPFVTLPSVPLCRLRR